MASDPYQVLGIDVTASLEEARAAYHRLVELFHPDRLRGVRRDVQAEAEKRLREATDAIKSIQSRFGRPLVSPTHTVDRERQARWVGDPAAPVPATAGDPGPSRLAPSDESTGAEARVYQVAVRAVEGSELRARWYGDHAAAVLAALRHAHRVDGPIHQIEWGTYEIILDGAAARRLLCSVDADAGWPHERAEVVQPTGDVEVEALADVLDAFEDAGRYSIVAEVY